MSRLRHRLGRAARELTLGLAGLLCLTVLPASSAPRPDGQAAPWVDGEELIYEITWPSGLSLGEASFRARATQSGWSFESDISASLPTMEIRDEYRSEADMKLCSFEFEKNGEHGVKKLRESITYDQSARRATRRTQGGGGESEFEIPPCARDALTYLYFLRRELGSGSVPPPDDINFGGQYEVVISYAQSLDVEVRGETVRADRILIDLAGPASHHSIEMFVAQDAARTPLIIRVPFDLGTFSLKLMP